MLMSNAKAQSAEGSAALRVRVFPHDVQISSGYNGAHLFLFGVTPPETDAVLRVTGPVPKVTMNRYGRILGLIWMPVERFEVLGLPSFYAVLSSRSLDDLLSVEDQRRLMLDPKGIGLRQRVTLRSLPSGEEISGDLFATYFQEVFDLELSESRFLWAEKGVTVAGPDFEAVLDLPSGAVPGTYDVQVLAIRDKKVVATNRTTLLVHKVGLVNTLAVQAVKQPALTGLLAVILPAIAGLGVARLFGMRGRH
jgi:hypothetical protein